MNAVHHMKVCDLCKRECHGYYPTMFGDRELNICINCKAMLVEKQDMMQQHKYIMHIEIEVTAPSESLAIEKAERVMSQIRVKNVEPIHVGVVRSA